MFQQTVTIIANISSYNCNRSVFIQNSDTLILYTYINGLFFFNIFLKLHFDELNYFILFPVANFRLFNYMLSLFPPPLPRHPMQSHTPRQAPGKTPFSHIDLRQITHFFTLKSKFQTL